MALEKIELKKKCRKVISHYLLDVANPKRKFTVVQYRKLALKAINKILKKVKFRFCAGARVFIFKQ